MIEILDAMFEWLYSICYAGECHGRRPALVRVLLSGAQGMGHTWG